MSDIDHLELRLRLARAYLAEATRLLHFRPAWATSMSEMQREEYLDASWEMLAHAQKALKATQNGDPT